jgi:hypothetical protein
MVGRVRRALPATDCVVGAELFGWKRVTRASRDNMLVNSWNASVDGPVNRFRVHSHATTECDRRSGKASANHADGAKARRLYTEMVVHVLDCSSADLAPAHTNLCSRYFALDDQTIHSPHPTVDDDAGRGGRLLRSRLDARTRWPRWV